VIEQTLLGKFDEAKHAPVHDRPPCEIGQPLDNYRPIKRIVSVVNHIESIKAHMRELTPNEWKQLAREIRCGLRIRLCNDEVIHALLKTWAFPDSKPNQPASLSRSDQAALVGRPAVADEANSRLLAGVPTGRMPRSES
jgi:hypothetical protein